MVFNKYKKPSNNRKLSNKLNIFKQNLLASINEREKKLKFCLNTAT